MLLGTSTINKTSLDCLHYNRLYILAKTAEQQEPYQLLYHGFKNGLSRQSIRWLFKNQSKFKGWSIPALCEYYSRIKPETPTVEIILTTNIKDIPPPDTLDQTKRNLMVYDDCLEENQSLMKKYYTRGRHSNCNVIYLTQSYFEIDRKHIRGNSNYFILFKLSAGDRDRFHRDILSGDISFKDFQHLTDEYWKTKYNYVAVNSNPEDPKDLIKTNIFAFGSSKNEFNNKKI